MNNKLEEAIKPPEVTLPPQKSVSRTSNAVSTVAESTAPDEVDSDFEEDDDQNESTTISSYTNQY